MIYYDFKGKKISKLAFGMMRLPTDKDGVINEEEAFRMVDRAIEGGVNYFDTAYAYHGGMSEIVTGKALARHPRESFYIASKYPGHQMFDIYNPEEIFEEQLKKCGVDYFDFYLMHNVYEQSINVYKDERWKIIDYFREQKKAGRIKHLGFSCHGRLDNLKEFVDYCGEDMEFCQIQLNYLDWTLQGAKEKYEYLKSKGIPVWVMEPVRGGRLADLGKDNEVLSEIRPGMSMASWAFKWLLGLDGVGTILSGMSTAEQVEDNLKTFSDDSPLTEGERELLADIAEGMKNSIPCTACKYCVAGCPVKLDIPTLISLFNDIRFSTSGGLPAAMQIEALEENARPEKCIKCGKCKNTCPQKIDVPKVLADFAAEIPNLPSWKKICMERAEQARKIKESK